MKSRIPKALSAGEELFALHCRLENIETHREFLFASEIGRKFRADFAWPEKKILAEIEGGSWSNGRHSRGIGFEEDCVKYNIAALLGYRVFRFTPGLVESGYAIATIKNALAGKVTT